MIEKVEISGICPHCKNNSLFRTPTTSECMTIIGKFAYDFIFGDTWEKINKTATVISEVTDKRVFENYKCYKCENYIMQCSACNEIIPYEHDGRSHRCNTEKTETSENPALQTRDEDVLTQLERLGALREKGLLSSEEFEKQKQRILA